MERHYSEGGSSDSSSYPKEYNNSSSPPIIFEGEVNVAGSSSSGGRSNVKQCGVCGDVAKSYHFGGLSCDSCKAFFRRSVQNDNYLHFQCCHRGQCIISLSNRKSCQYCRMNRCFAIGMEKSWVMTEEERKALMKARAEKKLTKKAQSNSNINAIHNQNSSSSSSSTGDQSPESFAASSATDVPYEPQIERMIDFLAPLEIKEIESIVTKYMHAYQHVPYRAELRFFDNDRPGVQVMEMFGTLVRRFAFYARLMADFTSLSFQDQSILLKGGVLEMCLLRGALVFDPQTNRWPNANMSMYKDAPVLKLDNIGHLTSMRLFQMHLDFIVCIQQMSVDEPIIMLLVLIVLFTPERTGLIHPDWVGKYQAYYTSLLEHYMNWRFGPVKARIMFGKVLTKLSDLRELSDTHNHYNLRLANDEVSSIQNQLNSLKLNPYPEMKVVNEFEEPSSAPPADKPLPNSYTNTDEANVSPTINAKAISNCLSEVELGPATTFEQPPLPDATTSQNISPELQTGTVSHGSSPYDYLTVREHNGSETQHLNQSHYTAEQQQMMAAAMMSQTNVNSHQKFETLQQQHLPPAGMNMAMQFMQAMQRSVTQVVNSPHFGFEWVKPDYQFDPETAFSTENVGLASNSANKGIDLTSNSGGVPSTLTDGEVSELFNVLEEYTGTVMVDDERMLTGADIRLHSQPHQNI